VNVDEMIIKKKEYGFSYEYISEKSGVPISTVQKVFSKTTPTPRRETLEALNNAFKEYLESVGNFCVTQMESQGETHTGYLCCGETEENSEISMACESEAEYNYGTSALAKGYLEEKTVDDYMNLPEGTRVELIDGVFYDMAAPTTIHQSIAFEIGTELRQFIKSNKGSCVPFVAPTDVQLDCDDKTMVQPDVMVICDRNKISKARIVGAPDLVIEVLSDSHWYNDMVIKCKKYKMAGVREYWIVIPSNHRVVVYNFERPSKDLEPSEYTFTDKIPVGIWNGKCVVDFKEISDSISFLM